MMIFSIPTLQLHWCALFHHPFSPCFLRCRSKSLLPPFLYLLPNPFLFVYYQVVDSPSIHPSIHSNSSYLTPNTDNRLPLHEYTQNRPNPQPLPATCKTLPRRPPFPLIQLRHLAFLRFSPRRLRTHISYPIPARHMALTCRTIMAFRLGNNRRKVHHHPNVLGGYASVADKNGHSAEL